MLTTHSYDLDTPGAQPWVTNPNSINDSAAAYVLPAPTAQPFDYHARGSAGYQLTQMPSTVNNGSVKGSDFLPNDGRTRVLPRLDLNRKLTPYPTQAAYYKPQSAGGLPASAPAARIHVRSAAHRPLTDPSRPYQYYRAVWERQNSHARFSIGWCRRRAPCRAARSAADTDHTSARRYLAQLAVNIVDYIDDDEFSTPFFWDDADPNDVVFGVESPKVVVNEIYGEIRNAANDTTGCELPSPLLARIVQHAQGGRSPASFPPGTDYNADPLTGDNRGFAQLQDFYVDPATKHPIYQVLIYEQQAGFTPNDMRAVSPTFKERPVQP